MTRAAALAQVKNMLGAPEHTHVLILGDRSWGKAAAYVLEKTGREDLADAIWEGKR